MVDFVSHLVLGKSQDYQWFLQAGLLDPHSPVAPVMLSGFFLSRLRLHDGKLIKDRRYHLRTYPNCFVAKELTDWLIDHKEAPDRETGIRLMQKLMDHYIIHHGVCVSVLLAEPPRGRGRVSGHSVCPISPGYGTMVRVPYSRPSYRWGFLEQLGDDRQA